ncbi:hypothetical protein BFJ63_vAg9633 [Fusarium oxysporum f. sp. narcissi]|uniref:Uncharacterized protein n=3 Tax=Fusarium oxysporum TaxID=5507 RepID=A0A420P254_FUSOX|nr:hypothetical protein H9L39_01606 [Fusarium oxysporum f. sp. albedinis]RKK29615.1 hypothetical protein BFJ65_g1531 [Fusarium oxysporum f. sp. cepae]RKK86608.1 hypothetical protein BFJ69_g832 [Fusarium oxysporum]RYC87470.1 hypothetical protein BFJ63_vAg9633 [Fusarium oxysporum f. sp. narcissi]
MTVVVLHAHAHTHTQYGKPNKTYDNSERGSPCIPTRAVGTSIWKGDPVHLYLVWMDTGK